MARAELGPPPPSRPAVSVRDLWKSYPNRRDGRPVHVLERIDLDVRPGEFVCIVGPSGCGKSTLLNIIGGFVPASRGQVLVEGEPVRGPDPRRIFVFQENGVFPWLTVQDNIGFGLLGRPREERQEIVRRYIAMVALGGFERSYPRELSGGMRQRVEIARALAANPDLIYMDEPFGALDFLTRLKMRSDLVNIWREERKTILFVTHDIEEAVQLADRVVVMSRRPATIQAVVEVDLPRPRDLDSPQYLRARDRIFETMGMSLKVGEEDGPRGVSVGGVPPEVVSAPRVAPRLDAEVVIIGGGPAGSTLGAYLARAGVDHLILDRAVPPGRHAGESLVCSTTRLFDEIGFLPAMEREGFVRKHGVGWTDWVDGRRHELRFGEVPGLGIAQDYTYHVDRGRFDELLLRHAESRGSRVLRGAQVEGVEFGPRGGAVGVRVDQGGDRRTLRCRLVVDASGRSTVLGHQLKLKRRDPLFHQFAVHNWFEGVDPGPAETANFTHIHLLPLPRGWAWQIPLGPTVTSVGVVTERAEFVRADEDPAAFFDRLVADNPVLARRMESARPLHEYQREGNSSYVMDRFVGDGWALVGDAARFIDPVFSSGVGIAMESARRLAKVIPAALSRGEVTARSLAPYEEAIRAGIDIWREFVLLYYALPPLFLDLLARPDARPQLVRLLEGDVYDRRSVPILDQMRREVEAIGRQEGHPWRRTRDHADRRAS